MRRNVGGHTHGDTGGTIDQQGRHTGRQYIGDLLGVVVVGNEIDGFFFKIGQQLVGDLGHPHFGVTHGSGRVAIY